MKTAVEQGCLRAVAAYLGDKSIDSQEANADWPLYSLRDDIII